MSSKAQSGSLAKALTASRGSSELRPPQSVARENSYKAVPVSNPALRNVDADCFFEAAPDAMVLVDAEGRMVMVNLQTERMFGYRREELVGEPVEKLLPERFRNRHIELRFQYNGAMSTQLKGMGTGLDFYGQRKDGSEFPIGISLSAIWTDQGILVSSAIRDISDHKLVRELHSRLEFQRIISRLSRTFINLPVDRVDNEIVNGLKDLAETLDFVCLSIVSTCSGKTAVTHSWIREGVWPVPSGETNDLYDRLAAYTSSHEIFRVWGPDDLPEEAVGECEYGRPEGSISWLNIPLLVGGEQLGRISAGMFRKHQTWDPILLSRFQQAADIFASALSRKRAAEAQLETEERFRLVANSAPVLIWMSGTDKPCTFFNEGWLAFTGRTMEEELGEGWASGVHPEDLSRCLGEYSAAFDARSEFVLEYRLRRYDGTFRWIVDHGVPRFGLNGGFLGYIGSCIDMTERKMSEQAIAEQLRFETLLAELSAALINVSADQVESRIKEAQARICETLDFDRSTLAQMSPKKDEMTVTHSWAAVGYEPVSSNISPQDLPWTWKTVLSGQSVTFSRIDDLPEEAAKDKETLRRDGPTAGLIFPLSAGGEIIGAIGFGSLRGEREWPAKILERLGLVAQVVASALARARVDRTLQGAYAEIDHLKRRLEKENIYLRQEVKLEHNHTEVIGDSAGIRRVLEKAEQVAPTDSTVLLLGETGTGKELIARTVHEMSRRKSRIMVKVNCAALPASLVDSELFGREKGAFTGALTREIGRFELANGSTILLDEIGELPLELQAKLLRVLQEGEFERLGNPRTIKVDVRVIAATSRNLQDAVREGRFREDLFYRLNVFPVTIPPLRERRDDIPALVWHFVNDIGQRMGRPIEVIPASTMEALKTYYWPGNIRELRNVIERFLITSTTTVFRADLQAIENPKGSAATETFEAVERKHILHILDLVGWRVRGAGGAAEILGLKPTTLESRMQRLGISRSK